MAPTETKRVTCRFCWDWKMFERPDNVTVNTLVKQTCNCGRPLTFMWKPPTRFSLLEVD